MSFKTTAIFAVGFCLLVLAYDVALSPPNDASKPGRYMIFTGPRSSFMV